MGIRVVSYRAATVVLAVVIAAGIAGCGYSSGDKGSVRGKVVANGQPVTAGQVMFAPASGTEGAPAIGSVESDGTFTLTTDKSGDGAAVGKHTVTYTAPPPEGAADWDGYGTPPPMTKSPFDGMVPKETEVEVKAGSNDITIELVGGS
jgi:hypothetical protein